MRQWQLAQQRAKLRNQQLDAKRQRRLAELAENEEKYRSLREIIEANLETIRANPEPKPAPRAYTIKVSSEMADQAKDWQPIRELGDWYRIETHDDGTADMIFLRGTSHPETMLDQRRAELSQRLTQRALQPGFNWAKGR